MFALPFSRFTMLAGSVLFFLLAVLSLVFYLERIIFIDISYQLFFILKNNDFAIQHNRVGAFFTMAFPLLASKLSLPLKQVMQLYSVGFIIYYFTIFLLITVWLKNYRLGLVLLFFCTLFVTDTFYWPISELPQGIAFLMLIFAFMQRYPVLKNYNPVLLTVLFLMLVCVTYFHPLLLFPLIFLAAFFWFREETSNSKTLLITSVVFFVALTFFKTILKPAGYDSTALSNTKNIFTLFPNYFDLQANRDFIKYCLTDYYFIPVVFLLICFQYIRTRRLLSLLLFLAFFLGYLFLVNVSYYTGSHQFYIENLYLPLGLFLAVPFVYDFLPSLRNQNLAYGLIAAMLLTRVVHIGLNHQKFTDRLNWNRKLLSDTAQLPKNKLVINSTDTPMDTLYMTWSSPYELLLLSAKDNPESARLIIIDEEPDKFSWMLDEKRTFIGKWESFNYDALPARYFRPSDQTGYMHYRPKTK